MTKKIIFTVLYIALMVSCYKDKYKAVPVSANARVVDQGNVAADGCGWHIITDEGTDYIPKNLDPAFETDNLAVVITFTVDDSLPCGFTAVPNLFPAINLVSIQKR